MSETAEDGWQARADELHEEGDVPERRAQVVALREQGLTYSEIGDELGLSRSGVSQHLSRYEESLDEAAWLLEHGPAAGELG